MPAGIRPRRPYPRHAPIAKAVLATIQKLGQQGTSGVPALRAQVMAIHLQHIEGVQEHIGRALPAKHSAHAVEIGDTVRSADHTLAVEDHRTDRHDERAEPLAMSGTSLVHLRRSPAGCVAARGYSLRLTPKTLISFTPPRGPASARSRIAGPIPRPLTGRSCSRYSRRACRVRAHADPSAHRRGS